jgi:hypothetical protein
MLRRCAIQAFFFSSAFVRLSVTTVAYYANNACLVRRLRYVRLMSAHYDCCRSLPSESSALFLYSLLQSHGTFTDVLIRSGMDASGLGPWCARWQLECHCRTK